MRFPTVLAVLSPVLLLLATTPAMAQMGGQKPAVYTYVAEWDIPRAQWGDMEKMQQSSTTVLDRLLADGTLVTYGADEAAIHDRKGATHDTWFQATSLAGIFKALDALQGNSTQNASLLGSGPHQDFLLVSHDYDMQAGSFPNSLLRGLSVVVKPGMERQFQDSWDRIIRPMLQRLTTEGALHGWAYEEQWIVKDPGRVTAIIIANGAAGLDRYVAAINEMLAKNRDAVAPLIEASVPGSRRDFLVRVTSLKQK